MIDPGQHPPGGSWVDLSHSVRTGIQVYPGDPESTIEAYATIEADGVALTHLDFGSHTGTHLDAPSHTIAGGRTVDRIRLDEVTGPARKITMRGLRDQQLMTLSDVRQSCTGVDLPRIVFLETGWDTHFGTPRYLRHPCIAVEAVQWLWDRGARVFGFDTLNPDPTLSPDGQATSGLPVHSFILGNDGLIVENLTRLCDIPADRDVYASLLPLRLDSVDGSPIRAAVFS